MLPMLPMAGVDVVAWVAGIDPDKHLDLQTLGWDKCTAAMEEAISSEKAEPIFQAAADKFQEVAATGGPMLSLLVNTCVDWLAPNV